mmetsp:Transcript_6064/g.24228  ORF Transcript_6064/g.24228 Transcript_6064/m.24228 type:complete len:234 (+) Transcript_6064:3424-4125(+)
MADLVAQDQVEDLAGAPVTGADELGAHRGRGVQAAGLQRAGHEGDAGEQVVARALGHAPQRVVGVEVAVVEAQLDQVVAQQREVQRLLGRDAQPVAVKGFRHARKAPGDVQRQVDRVELDVGDGVDEGGDAGGCAHRWWLERDVLDQARAQRSTGDSSGLGQRGAAVEAQVDVQRPCGLRLGERVAEAQDLQGAGTGFHARHYRQLSRAASRRPADATGVRRAAACRPAGRGC